MTAWDQPCPLAYWGGTPEQLCAATRAGHCLPPGAVLQEDKDAKRIPRSWATGSPELRVPDPNPTHWSCWLHSLSGGAADFEGDPLALGLYLFSPPEFTPMSGVMLYQAVGK